MDKRTETIDSIMRNTGAPWAAVAAAYDAGAASIEAECGRLRAAYEYSEAHAARLMAERDASVAAGRIASAQPLTDAQIVALVGPHADIVPDSRGRMTYEFDSYGLIAFARAVKAAKGE